MATYTKGFKKQKSELILLYVIVGIIGVVLLTVGIAFAYDKLSATGSYDDYTHITAYDKVLVQKDADDVQVQDYIIYFYNDTCENCAAIQRDALRLVARINRNDTVVYFVNTAEITETDSGDRDDFLAAINESSLRTPMLVIVNDGVFEETAIGSTAVIALLTDVKSGDYVPFQ